MMLKVASVTLLMTCAYATPVPRGGRQLQGRTDDWSMDDGLDLTAAVTAQLSDNAASGGGNHLYFYYINWYAKGEGNCQTGTCRCGEVDAAPYMPASLFEPRNFPALLAYAQATTQLYQVPAAYSRATVKLGRCKNQRYSAGAFTRPAGTASYGGLPGVPWTSGYKAGVQSSMMGPVCEARCKCVWSRLDGRWAGYTPNPDLPMCKDVPDDPAAGKWCSLCGPTTACPGCTEGTATVNLYSLVPTAKADTEGSQQWWAAAPRLVAQELYGSSPLDSPLMSMDGLTDMSQALQAQMAENQANPAGGNHLYFYWISSDPTHARPGQWGDQCGEIDAATFMPAALFDHPFRLFLYAQATISLYGWQPPSAPSIGGPSPGELKIGRCQNHGYPRACGINCRAPIRAMWTPMDIQGPVCKLRCQCQWQANTGSVYGPAANLPVCQDVPDDPTAGRYCSLCGPNAPGNCPDTRGTCVQDMDLFLPASSGGH